MVKEVMERRMTKAMKKLLAQWKGQSPSKHCNKSNIRLLRLLSALHRGVLFTLLQDESHNNFSFHWPLLLYSSGAGADLSKSSSFTPLQCWHLEESLTNLFSAGSSVSEKGFNHLIAVRTSTKHTSKSLLERGNYWEDDLNKQNRAKSALTLLWPIHYTYTSLNKGWLFNFLLSLWSQSRAKIRCLNAVHMCERTSCTNRGRICG